MCNECWVDMGAPCELPPHTAEIVGLIDQLHTQPDGGTGGPLHVLLNDFDIDYIEPFRERDWEPQTWRLAALISAYMRPLSSDERAAVLAAWEGWIDVPGVPRRRAADATNT